MTPAIQTSGLNSAAAAGVDMATATGDVIESTSVASRTSPAYGAGDTRPLRRPGLTTALQPSNVLVD